ncbi:MAG: T9SS type A sorting domain-containing protein [Ferruginibacter sp.]
MKKIYLTLFTLITGLASYAQPGTPDPTFGTAGKVTTSIGSVSRIKAMAIQADGKIVVAGLSHTNSNKDFGIARYNTNGTLDNSFDVDGKVITAIGTGDFDDIALCVAIQADGKIVAAGYTNNASDADFAIVRYNTDGSLDNSFDGDGIVITSFGSANNASINCIAIQADGKIVVAGLAYSGSDNDFVLARYNTDGSLDNSFDTDGKVQTPIGASNDVVNSIVIQADGKIVAAGTTYFPTKFAVARYNTNGSLDNSFDGDGKVITAIGSSADIANSIAIQIDGKLVVAGQSYVGSNNYFAVARYNTDGSPDNSFDGDGKLTSAIGPFNAIAYTVAIQADAKIIVAGYCETLSTNNDFAVVRYNSDGSLDNSFDGDGKVITNINGFDYIYAMKLSGYRIYVGGVSNDDIFTLVAYQNDALPVPLKLTGFTASRQGNNNELYWHTATEQNTAWFDIERSNDGNHFLRIGQVQAAGNSASLKNYSFIDLAPSKGYNYYRLKQTDADARFTYSAVICVSNNESELSFSFSPNPASNFINIIYTGKKEILTISIYDEQGKLVNKQIQKNALPITIEVKLLAPGNYFIQMLDGKTVTIAKFVKQ